MPVSQFQTIEPAPVVSADSPEVSEEMRPGNPRLDLRAGDLVQVRTEREILKTLDANGTMDNMPFMPEMLQFCGKQFRVLNRMVQSTIDGAFLARHAESYVREFRNNDVVILQGVRCSGAEHDDCQRGCAIFWKEAWLEKVNPGVDERDLRGSPFHHENHDRTWEVFLPVE
jgi:hypothetical protein